MRTAALAESERGMRHDHQPVSQPFCRDLREQRQDRVPDGATALLLELDKNDTGIAPGWKAPDVAEALVGRWLHRRAHAGTSMAGERSGC